MQITLSGVRTVRVSRMSVLSRCVTLTIEHGDEDTPEILPITLFGLSDNQRLHLCNILCDAASTVRTANDEVSMAEWLVENAVHKEMGVDGD